MAPEGGLRATSDPTSPLGLATVPLNEAETRQEVFSWRRRVTRPGSRFTWPCVFRPCLSGRFSVHLDLSVRRVSGPLTPPLFCLPEEMD